MSSGLYSQAAKRHTVGGGDLSSVDKGVGIPKGLKSSQAKIHIFERCDLIKSLLKNLR